MQMRYYIFLGYIFGSYVAHVIPSHLVPHSCSIKYIVSIKKDTSIYLVYEVFYTLNNCNIMVKSLVFQMTFN